MLADATQRIESHLLSARQALDEGRISIATRAVIGDAAPEIVRVAADFDLVVMGTRGRGGLAHLLVGSVAERVVRTCRRPVLTTHSHQE
jgi:nucleotide-binding universal stress UspA family protein